MAVALVIGAPATTAVAEASASAQTRAPSAAVATRVVIFKSARKLLVYANGLVVDSFKIALGLEPVGDKRRRGDNKTPTGDYTLDWRNPDSRFHRSLHISYPNARDRADARAHDLDPGDNIMIHGQPDYDSRKRVGDWTHGCIAVSNAAINQIWRTVPDGTPIEIYP